MKTLKCVTFLRGEERSYKISYLQTMATYVFETDLKLLTLP